MAPCLDPASQHLQVLEYPNSIAVEASQRRMELATQAEAVEPALDAAVAGENSLVAL